MKQAKCEMALNKSHLAILAAYMSFINTEAATECNSPFGRDSSFSFFEGVLLTA